MQNSLDSRIIALMTVTKDNLPVDHAEMVDFARRWYPYGGGTAEDILVEFGIGEHEYFRRLTEIIDGLQPADQDVVVYAAMRSVAADRLAA